MLRRGFLSLAIVSFPAYAQSVGPGAAAGGTALERLSIASLTAGADRERWGSQRLSAAYLARIEAIDRHGPQLRSVLELNPEALRSARQLDRERVSGRVRGALHGVPILLKDNIDTLDSMHTTAGSLALLNSMPRQDAFIVRRLRAAGALILGKTNMSEWANYRSRHSSSGWSARGGQTRNPYALERNPCGSSAGSAVAVAADLTLVAVGTETDGSITCPAAVNGIVGIKPTLGLVSRSGIIPIAASQDTAGPMARTVADAAALLNVLAGFDPEDPATMPLRSIHRQIFAPRCASMRFRVYALAYCANTRASMTIRTRALRRRSRHCVPWAPSSSIQ